MSTSTMTGVPDDLPMCVKWEGHYPNGTTCSRCWPHWNAVAERSAPRDQCPDVHVHEPHGWSGFDHGEPWTARWCVGVEQCPPSAELTRLQREHELLRATLGNVLAQFTDHHSLRGSRTAWVPAEVLASWRELHASVAVDQLKEGQARRSVVPGRS